MELIDNVLKKCFTAEFLKFKGLNSTCKITYNVNASEDFSESKSTHYLASD